VYRDLPLIDVHPGALLAAHAANCAADQGAFWPMHDRLFMGQAAGEWGRGDAGDFQTFLVYAGDLSLDVAALQSCIETNRHAARIEADVRDAFGRGFNNTPSFLVNGRPVIGALPYATWERLFDDLLANQ
jgi:protein-disulfide isomerase